MTDMNEKVLKVSGEVDREQQFSYVDLTKFDSASQVPDVSQLVPGRTGTAVTLEGLLAAVGVRSSAAFIGLHSEFDNFHASVPLAAVRHQGLVIYGMDSQPLPREKGGPVRFYIPDHAACKTAEVDECANVKFVDHIELTVEKGFDNRPEDEEEHAKLHDHS